MSENTADAGNQTVDDTGKQEAKTERVFTQAEMDAIIGDRLNRERSKYADYDDLKAKAAKLDELEEAGKTELEKTSEALAAVTKELEQLKAERERAALVAQVADETGVPQAVVASLNGADADALKAQAEAIAASYKGANASIPEAGRFPRGDAGAAKSTADIFANVFNESLRR